MIAGGGHRVVHVADVVAARCAERYRRGCVTAGPGDALVQKWQAAQARLPCPNIHR